MNCYCPNYYLLTGTTEPQTCDTTTCTASQRANLVQDTCTTCLTANCACGNNTFLSEYDNAGTTNLRCAECPNGYYSKAVTELVYNCTACAAEGQIAGTNGVCACVAPKELQSSF